MKLIESKVEYIPQEPGLEGIYKMIELAGRTAYKSEDKITPDSAKAFVDRMIASEHYAMLEHGTVYLCMPSDYWQDCREDFYNNSMNSYSYISEEYATDPANENIHITTNYRMLIERGWLNDLDFLCEPTEHHERRITLRFITSIGIVRELIRHRTFSFANESTRYCNYSKNKFDNEITFIEPSWFEDFSLRNLDNNGHRKDGTTDMFTSENDFIDLLIDCQNTYMAAIYAGATPQQAREVLPLCTKSELVMTGFASDWARLFELRLHESTGKVVPDMKILMQKAWKEFENYGITRDLERYIKL